MGSALITMLLSGWVIPGCASPVAGITPPADAADAVAPHPGTVIDATPMSDVDESVRALGATAVRVRYRSTSGLDGSPTEVTAALFVPSGKPPQGGWPVIAFAHGTTGINPDCGPSQTPDLLGSIGFIAGFLQLGYAVTATDYQGLGGPGPHPYLDAKTAGLNVIDSVRALREISHEVSRRWGAFGGSQGGAATWAANEQASTYATDLDLVGSVSLAPTVDMTGLAAAAAAGTLTEDQEGVYIWTLIGVERTRPGFNVDDYRHGLATDKWTVLSECSGPAAAKRLEASAQLAPQDLQPSTSEAEQKLADILHKMALPQQRASAPMLVIYGGADTYIDPAWTTAAVARACDMGSWIATVFEPGKGHSDIDTSAFAGWLIARFNGLPAPSNC